MGADAVQDPGFRGLHPGLYSCHPIRGPGTRVHRLAVIKPRVQSADPGVRKPAPHSSPAVRDPPRMPFLLLLFLLLACMPLPWPEPPAILGTGGSLAATAGLMAALVAAAAVRAGRTRRQLIVHPDDRED